MRINNLIPENTEGFRREKPPSEENSTSNAKKTKSETAVSQRLINFTLLVGFSSSGPLSGGFAPPAAQANLRSVFHDFKACATLRILHFYIELMGLETKNANCRWQKKSLYLIRLKRKSHSEFRHGTSLLYHNLPLWY